MSDLKMSDAEVIDVEVIDCPTWTLKDFLPSKMAIINRSGLPDPLTLEIVDRRNWREVVTVYGEGRDAKLVLKALTSYDSNQELIAKQAEEIKEFYGLCVRDGEAIIKQAAQIKQLREALIDADEWLDIDSDYGQSPLCNEVDKALAETKD